MAENEEKDISEILSNTDNNDMDSDNDDSDIFASAMQDQTLDHEEKKSNNNITAELPKLTLKDALQDCNTSELSSPTLASGSISTPLDPSGVNICDMQDIPITDDAKPSTDNFSNMIEEEPSEANVSYLKITVTSPQKIGEGMGAYVAYKVETKTNMKIYKKNSFSVHRRFSDFLGLQGKLSEKYLRNGRIIPPAPEKSVIGATKVKMSGDKNAQEQSATSFDFIERRRASLERFLNRVAAHSLFCIDPDFREFLEADVELPRATNTSALSGAGVMRLFNKVGETVNKITYKMDENDIWFEEMIAHVESLDAQLRLLHSAVETLTNQRRELATCTEATARSIAVLGHGEPGASLGRALAQLAEILEKVESVRKAQSNSDLYQFGEMLRDYVALIGAIKDVFHERVKVFQNWQHAQLMLNKKREQKARLEQAGRSDKLDQAATEVIEWEAKVERGQEEFENISKMIRSEVERFEELRIQEFKKQLTDYLKTMLQHQNDLIKHWESFLPEARAVA